MWAKPAINAAICPSIAAMPSSQRAAALPSSTGTLGNFEDLSTGNGAECLNAELFCFRREAQIVIEQRVIEYNTRRPHFFSVCRPPAPQDVAPASTLDLANA